MRSVVNTGFAVALTIAAIGASSALAAADLLAPGDTVDDFRLLDHLGQSHQLYYLSDMKAVVLIAQGDGSAERLTGEIVDRRFAVVQHGVRNAIEVFADERREIVDLLTNCERTDLLVITDDGYAFAEVPGEKAADVGLARLVHDHHIESAAREVH